MNSFYVITRGVKPGKALTTAQRSSSKFSEEPVVLGKVLRSRSLPMKVSAEQFELNRVELERLVKAGAIHIQAPNKPEEVSLSTETSMGTPSSKFGGTPTVHPAEAGTPPETPVVETAPVVPEVTAPMEVAPSAPVEAPVEVVPVETAPAVTEMPEKQEEAPVEVKSDFRGKKGQRR